MGVGTIGATAGTGAGIGMAGAMDAICAGSLLLREQLTTATKTVTITKPANSAGKRSVFQNGERCPEDCCCDSIPCLFNPFSCVICPSGTALVKTISNPAARELVAEFKGLLG